MPTEFSPSSSQARVAAGTRLNGIFEIDGLIASGGMGEVYRGHAIHTGDVVAIKLLRPEFGENEAALALFRKEASALHSLHHEAIVRNYVCSVDPDLRRPYLAMEFVDGQSLSQLLRHGPLTFEAVRNLGRRIAAGLDAAHECGIVHRDVAPDNVIIPGGDVGRAKIIDFGIARFMQTNDGTIIGGGFAGKYKYVSPEQLGLFGGEVTGKSDIYSLALLLVEALTGQPVDMGGSQVQVVEKRRKVPDLGGIDMRIRPLLEKMLQPDPADRPESMKNVVAMMTEQPSMGQRSDPPRTSPADQQAKRKRWFVAALACIAVLASTGGALLYLQPEFLTQVLPPAGQADKENSAAKEPGPALQSPPLQAPQSASAPTPATQPVPSLEPSKSAAIAPPATIRPPRPASDGTLPSARLSRIDTIARYVNDYDGGDCFFATATSVGETAARIEGFGASTAPFQTLDDSFKKTNGFEANIGVRQVTPSQCPAITFLSQVRGQRRAAPQLDIGQTNLKSGQSLTGTIDGYGDRDVELLLVSDDGSVSNVTRLVKTTHDGKTFNLRMSLSGTTAAQPQILMVVASARPLATLQLPQPADAAKVFSAALDEAARTSQAVAATARYFKLE